MLALGIVLALVALLVGGLALVRAEDGRHRAQRGADLASLAAAAAVQRDGSAPQACALAREVSGANGVALDSCALAGEVISVRTSVPVELGRFGTWTATAHAVAGPESAAQP